MCKHILFTKFNKTKDIETLQKFVEMTNENDGYGAIIRTKQNKLLTLKSLNQGSFYISLMDTIAKNDINQLIVHHRTSTNSKGIDYAHPFKYKGNLMTHNGVISTPHKYKTKTTNDSEELLHHLIETNFKTDEVDGYYSCFIMNNDTTTILVDDTANLYTDNRVYSSHKLNDTYQRISCLKIDIDIDNKIVDLQNIEVKLSNYGDQFKYLSLSNKYNNMTHDDIPSIKFKEPEKCRDFLDFLTFEEESYLFSISSDKFELELEIEAYSRILDIKLSKKDKRYLLSYFTDRKIA